MVYVQVLESNVQCISVKIRDFDEDLAFLNELLIDLLIYSLIY